jgi:hypothetical protein
MARQRTRIQRLGRTYPGGVDLRRPTTAGPGDIDWPTVAKDPRFTESREDLKKLYELAQYGQLNDVFMRGLEPDQVTFLAAHDPAVASFEVEIEMQQTRLTNTSPGLPYTQQEKKLHDLAGQKNKLEQNARRARLELDRRREDATRHWNRVNIIIAGFIGFASAIGGVLIGRW